MVTLVRFSLHQTAPLHWAVESNRIKMMESLLDHKADINLQDDNQVILILHANAVDYFELAAGAAPLFIYCTV